MVGWRSEGAGSVVEGREGGILGGVWRRRVRFREEANMVGWMSEGAGSVVERQDGGLLGGVWRRRVRFGTDLFPDASESCRDGWHCERVWR